LLGNCLSYASQRSLEKRSR